ncbi:hypothetical protein BCR36DRAFT_580580 [Piromyces finnis]|uniref:GDP/GTP exchange factor Sec2 N-terminal domain-containing protein n=1 Tax=Piromyces finnis TaxID=1754191 RepID=A0A1Y1VIE0_9FUNG|nr:hypothetical protein BCR36DRAFT_580580 [Piromyces finnis]|eukprot:ORX57166.1 hypothetical protein BCR36DRAFT_580580 [Piromyces finnis]
MLKSNSSSKDPTDIPIETGSESKISESKIEKQDENIIENVAENNIENKDNSMEKEKLKEDNERLKVDIEVLSKKLHDAVNRIGNLEKALENKTDVIETSNKPSLTYSTTTTTTTTTTSSIQAGGKTFTSVDSGIPISSDASIVIKMKDLESTVDRLNKRLLEEVEKRSELETSHSALVQETEDLTVKLFEEAQIMVANERKENFEKDKQIKKLKSIIDEKDHIIQALMEENKTLKIFIQNNTNKLNDAESEASSALSNLGEPEEDDTESNRNSKRISVRTRALSNVTEKLSATPFSPINSILSIENNSNDATYQTFAYQTINRELHFDNKNPYYNELYNYIKYKHYDILEHSRFTKRCIAEEIEPCLDFQPINPDLLTITTKLAHYNYVRRIVRACRENTLIIKNIYEYPDNTNISTDVDNKNDKEFKVTKVDNITCSLCLRNHLPLPLNRCFMDEEDRELQLNEKTQSQTTYVCKYCKERLLSVFDYYGYMKFVRTHLKDNKANEKPTEYCHNLFGDLLRIRERMYWAKFGLVGKDYGVNISLY